MADINDIIANLIKLLDTKLICFNELLNITKKQTIDIETNAADNLQLLVDQKQITIDKVDTIDKAFEVQFEMLKKTLNVKSLDEVVPGEYPKLKEVRSKVAQIMELAKSIMEIEKENSKKANDIFENVKSELKNIKLGKVSLRAYEKPSINVDGIYLDKKK